MGERLLILGASTRAAALSAVRAGFEPTCGDLFADEDLRRVASVTQVSRYPAGLAAVAAEAPLGPWMYTGALENYPDLVDEIAATRPLLGNPPEVLRAVRDPFQVAGTLRRAGLACPAVRRDAVGLPLDGSWLRKPLRGSAGTGITALHNPLDVAESREHYFQQRIDGWPCSAVYIAARGRAATLGATWQFLSTESGSFRYLGSMGPLSLEGRLQRRFERIGKALAADFRLAGLFGVDAILAEGEVWPVEVNPRYTASVEVLERAMGFLAVQMHMEACRGGLLPSRDMNRPRCVCGKKVLYARRDFVVPQSFAAYANQEAAGEWPDLADIPMPGTSIREGHPVLTVLGEAEDEHSLQRLLDRRLGEAESAVEVR